jgi:hypothetical protein
VSRVTITPLTRTAAAMVLEQPDMVFPEGVVRTKYTLRSRLRCWFVRRTPWFRCGEVRGTRRCELRPGHTGSHVQRLPGTHRLDRYSIEWDTV